MKISAIEITEFGGLKNRKIELGDKINLLYGHNESGKSTVMLFIKFMLYGMNTRKTAGISERDRMLSWDGSAACGSMDIRHGGKNYRLARSIFYRNNKKGADNISITDLDAMRAVDIDVTPGEFFLGIDAETFESTCSVGQFRTALLDSEKTGNAIDNILASADENIDTAKILDIFKNKIKPTYTRPNKQDGILDKCAREKSKLEEELETAKENHIRLRALYSQQEENREKTEAAAKHRQQADDFFTDADKIRTIREFERLRAAKENRDALAAEKKTLVRTSFKGGFIPTEGDLRDLKNSKTGALSARDEIENSKAALAELIKESEFDPEKIRLAKKIEDSGAQLLKVKAAGYKRNKSTFGVLAVLMLLFSLAALGFGVLDFLADAVLLYPLAGICLFMFIFFVFFTVISVKNSKKLKLLLAEYGVPFGGFAKLIDDSVAYLAGAKSAEEEKIRKESKIGYDRGIFEKALRRLSETLSRFGAESDNNGGSKPLSYSENPFRAGSDAFGDIFAAAESEERKCADFLAKHSALTQKITALDGFISQNESILSDKNEEKLRMQIKSDISAFTDEKLAEAEKNKRFYDMQYRANVEHGNELSRQIAALEAKIRNPLHIESELDAVREILAAEGEKLETLQMAFDAIEQAGEAMRNNVTPQIRGRANEIIAKISGGKYSELGLHKDLRPEVSVGSSTKSADALSGGTRDAVYLALRLSVLEILTGGNSALFLDESLSQLDDARAAGVLDFICSYVEAGGQCLIFTCHRREEDLLTAAGCEYKKIDLDLSV